MSEATRSIDDIILDIVQLDNIEDDKVGELIDKLMNVLTDQQVMLVSRKANEALISGFEFAIYLLTK